MRKYERNRKKEVVEIDFEGEGQVPVSLEAIESGAIIIVSPPEDEEEGEKNEDSDS